MVLCQRLDQWKLNNALGTSASNLVGDPLHQPVSHILQRNRLQRNCSCPSRIRALHERAPAQRLDCLQYYAAAVARAKDGQQMRDAHRLTLHGQHSQHLLLDSGTALELLVEHAPDAAENGG